MIPKVFKEVIDLGDGREITIETGKLAKQAHGSVVVTSGKCMLLCTVVSNYEQKDLGFLPLTVDYREKFAAAGRYPGGFFKREARPSDGEVLTMRLVDRVLRPLFPKDYTAETQVMIQLMSHDENVMPDAMAGLAASAAIQLSDFPFECAISEARVGRVNGEFVINPTRAQLAESDLDMMIGASADSVMMVEGEMDEISEEEMADAIKFAHEAIKVQCAAQLRLAEAFGKQWKTYQNSLIKNQTKFRGGRMQVADYFKFVHEAFLKITATKKTEKTKNEWMKRKEQYFKELRNHTRNMVAVTEFMGHIVNAKMKIIDKLNSIKQLGISTFVKTSDGFKVTTPEGYVVADSTQKAVKLVDRLEFSFNNFTAQKNWDK